MSVEFAVAVIWSLSVVVGSSGVGRRTPALEHVAEFEVELFAFFVGGTVVGSTVL